MRAWWLLTGACLAMEPEEPRLFRDAFGEMEGFGYTERWAEPEYLARSPLGEQLMNNVESYRHQEDTRWPRMAYMERREHTQVGFHELLEHLRSPEQKKEPSYIADCEIVRRAASRPRRERRVSRPRVEG